MGSKWIPIRKELPELEELVWVLVKSPAYHDLDSDEDIGEAHEIFIGMRFVPGEKERKKCANGYEYQLVFRTLEDTIYMHDETEEYPWGQRCEIVAWMPMNTPEAVFTEEMV